LGRLFGAVAGAAVAAGAVVLVEPGAAGAAVVVGAVAAVALALLPRVAWLLGAVAAVAWLVAGPDAQPGVALVVLVGVAAVPVILPAAGTAWSVPAAAPALGAIGLAAAFPAIAALASTAWRRAALGALGFWWLALAEALAGERLLLGPAKGTVPVSAWGDSGEDAVSGALEPLFSSGLLAGAVVWALAALVAPWVVRGPRLIPIAGAAAWAAGLALATAAVAPEQDARGLVAGGVLAGAIVAVAGLARARRTSHALSGAPPAGVPPPLARARGVAAARPRAPEDVP
jgi:hypothetical protein